MCLLLLVAGCRHVPEERFLANAQINGKPVRLAYDTGAGGTVLFTRSAKRLGLKVFEPSSAPKPAPGEVNVGHTGLCRFNVGSETFNCELQTLHLPWPVGSLLDVEGLIGWPDMMDDLLDIDTSADVIRFMDRLPDTRGWIKLPLYQRTSVLAVQVSRSDGKTGVIEIDTGNPGGVSLSPELWAQWRAAHPHVRGKRNIAFMPGTGTGVDRAFQAANFSVGPLAWTSVVVHKANQTEMSTVSSDDVFEASLGIAALKPFYLIVDQKNHAAYFRSRAAAAIPDLTEARNSVGSTVHLKFREHEYRDLAQAGFDSRNFRGALDEINRLLATQPDDVEALYLRGDIRYALRQWDDAAGDFRRVAELDPDNANYPQFYLWVVRSRGGQRAVADRALEAFFDHGEKPNGDAWERTLGSFLLGRLGEPEFLGAARNLPGDKAAHRCEAWFYAGIKRRLSGDTADARKYFRNSRATGQKDEDEYGFAAAELEAAD